MRNRIRRITSPSRAHLLISLLFPILLSVSALAQSPQPAARPDRGSVTGGAYAVSDVESVSLNNGNVSLSIPL
ncbi:MAG: hypothetical protein LC802_15935, partial [Acidobacteria bacterium]|nr:hypothetical protein [Acidobacteriota bacterium]